MPIRRYQRDGQEDLVYIDKFHPFAQVMKNDGSAGRGYKRPFWSAIYTPAVQPNFAAFSNQPMAPYDEELAEQIGVPFKRHLGHFDDGTPITPQDLNFLSPDSRLFFLPTALYSAAHEINKADPPPNIITQKADEHDYRFIIGDSGGYQVITGRYDPQTPQEFKKLVDWLNTYCSISMTLDVPTGAIMKGDKPKYTTFRQCLDAYLEFLGYFEHSTGKHYLVLQGRNEVEQNRWYEGVIEWNNQHPDFKPAGWAIATSGRYAYAGNWYLILKSLIRLIRDKKFGYVHGEFDCRYLHFLGIGDLRTAAITTTLQTVLEKRLRAEGLMPKMFLENDPQPWSLILSYDTSSWFQLNSKFRTTIKDIKFSAEKFRVDHFEINAFDRSNYGSTEPVPFSGSRISEILEWKDLMAYKEPPEGGGALFDIGSFSMLQNHNVQAFTEIILNVNDAIRQPRRRAVREIPYPVIDAIDAIKEVFGAKDMEATLEKHRYTLELVSNSTVEQIDAAYIKADKLREEKQPELDKNKISESSEDALIERKRWVSKKELGGDPEIMTHPIILEARQKILELHEPKHSICLFSLCTASRPYSDSAKWKDIIERFQNDCDLVVYTNGGVIPREFWNCYPYKTYDAPATLRSYDEIQKRNRDPRHIQNKYSGQKQNVFETNQLYRETVSGWIEEFLTQHRYEYVLFLTDYDQRIRPALTKTDEACGIAPEVDAVNNNPLLERLKQAGIFTDFAVLPDHTTWNIINPTVPETDPTHRKRAGYNYKIVMHEDAVPKINAVMEAWKTELT